MRMQRNSSFGRDDETGGRPERNLSFNSFFFELFSVGARKIIHKTPPRLTLATREGERVRVVLDLSAEGVSLLAASFFLTCSSSSFVVKSYENSFFCLRPDRWSLVWRRRGGFQMAKREGSRIFHQNFECFRRSSCIGGEGGAAFLFSFFVKRVFNVCLFSGARAYRLFI
jgi:hypothetical protein